MLSNAFVMNMVNARSLSNGSRIIESIPLSIKRVAKFLFIDFLFGRPKDTADKQIKVLTSGISFFISVRVSSEVTALVSEIDIGSTKQSIKSLDRGILYF